MCTNKRSVVPNWWVYVCLFQGDNSIGQALDDMMDGVLEGKKVDILKMVWIFFC